jgi:DNA repair ATPase RecN
MNNGMNIVRLQIKNFLSISDVSINPGHITQIVGQNNQGKTSILKAIQTALQGTNDPSVVKVGETQAEIILEFSDGLSVRRRVNANGTQDVKVSKNDMEAKSPQTLLNSLFESHGFNPLELLDAKRRTEALLSVIPAKLTQEQVEKALAPLPIPLPPTIDYTGHGLKVATQLHEYFYGRRAEANKTVKSEQARLNVESEKVSLVEPPSGSHDDAALDRMGGECDAEIRSLQQKRGEQNQKVHYAKELEMQVDREQRAVENFQRELTKAQAFLEIIRVKADAAQKDALQFGDPQPRLDELHGFKARHSVEKTKNAEYRTWLSKRDNLEGQRKRLDEATHFASELDRCVTSINYGLKTGMMRSVEMPIPGITFENDKFFFEGSAIENLSTSSSMKLACGLARALAKKTKVICLDGAEALDDESYAALKAQIQDDGYNYFISKVGDAFKESTGDTVVTMEKGAAHVH